jgi:hypothetical protein
MSNNPQELQLSVGAIANWALTTAVVLMIFSIVALLLAGVNNLNFGKIIPMNKESIRTETSSEGFKETLIPSPKQSDNLTSRNSSSVSTNGPAA